MTRYLMKYLLLVSLNFLSFSTYAWNALGHMVIADIAYRNLNPSAQSKVNYLISYFQKEYPSIKTFMEVATWADAIRSQKIGLFVHWHYIDNPFSSDGSPLKDTRDTDNAVWAMTNIGNVVTYPRANLYERSRFLAFLVHIVSDLHQPLHTVTNITADRPDGDRGGNLFYVYYHNQKYNLHRLWDQGVGLLSESPSKEHGMAISEAITAAYPAAYFGKKIEDLDPLHWTDEGMSNARQYVYNTSESHSVSKAYIEECQAISKQQIALAGYRVAALLNRLLS